MIKNSDASFFLFISISIQSLCRSVFQTTQKYACMYVFLISEFNINSVVRNLASTDEFRWIIRTIFHVYVEHSFACNQFKSQHFHFILFGVVSLKQASTYGPDCGSNQCIFEQCPCVNIMLQPLNFWLQNSFLVRKYSLWDENYMANCFSDKFFS